MAGQSNRFPGYLLGNPLHLKQYLAGLHPRHPMLGSSLSFPHPLRRSSCFVSLLLLAKGSLEKRELPLYAGRLYLYGRHAYTSFFARRLIGSPKFPSYPSDYMPRS